VEIVDLNDQSAKPVSAALRVPLPFHDVCDLSARDRNVFVVGPGHPSVTIKAEEELAKTRDMRADLTARANMNDMDVRFSETVSQFRGGSIATLKVNDSRELMFRGVEDNQGRTLKA
jgi:hypothetical protein